MTLADLTPERDVSPAAWIVDAVRPFGTGVGSLVPDGFDAYVRVLHPAHLGGRPVRWAAVAAANGRTAHAGMEWVAITGAWRYLHSDVQAGTWDAAPTEDTPDRGTSLSLARALAPFTAAERFWFAVWEGYGVLPEPWEAFPRVPMENRAMYLFAGTRADAGVPIEIFPWDQYANLWWPDDHAWCVASELDLMSTYVGGSRACIDAILRSPDLEAYEVSRKQTVHWDGDTVNPTPPRPPH